MAATCSSDLPSAGPTCVCCSCPATPTAPCSATAFSMPSSPFSSSPSSPTCSSAPCAKFWTSETPSLIIHFQRGAHGAQYRAVFFQLEIVDLAEDEQGALRRVDAA